MAALCDRRAGIGGDGVMRVIRTEAYDALPIAADAVSQAGEAVWFMDYRNSDGSVTEMCGNGIRVFARHLVDEGLATSPIPIATRDGVKTLTVEGDLITVDMGSPKVLGETRWVAAGGRRSWPARHVDMGNPHAVAFVDDLADAGPLLEPPSHDAGDLPERRQRRVRRPPRRAATSRCGCTSAARARPGPAAPARAR